MFLIDGCYEGLKVWELKDMITKVKQIPACRQQLLLGLDVLADVDSLGKAGVKDWSTVTLVQLESNDSDEDIPGLVPDSDSEEY